MKQYTRNVRLAGESGRRRGRLERLLISNRYVNRFLSWSAQLTLTALLWPRFVAPFREQITRHPMPLAGIDPAFRGYRILQLTDLHVGRARLSYLHRAVARALEEKPDLVVITGDLIDYHPRSLPRLVPLLEQIVRGAGTDGVVAIFGNHDYHEYSWRHIGARSAHRAVHKRLVRLVEGAGIRLLRNQRHVVRRGAGTLTIVGMDEMWTGRADAAAAFAGIAPGEPVICLQHNPDGIEFLRDWPWHFMLCGHSHGGQAHFPMLGALYVPMEHREYLRGFYHFPPAPAQAAGTTRTVFVSRGLGYSTPIRLRCPPEATLFEVVPQPA